MKIRKFIKKNKDDLIFLFFIICSCLGMMIFTRSDSDHFWHLTAGKYMLKNHTILTHDIFSWFVNGKYWMSHEWLSEITLGIFNGIFGKYHIIVFCFFIIILNLRRFIFYLLLLSYGLIYMVVVVIFHTYFHYYFL